MLLALLLYAAQMLPPWQAGMFDIHQIHTGRGNATLFVFPDGKTMLLDAGAVADKPGLELGPRRPNATRTTAQWLATYIRRHTEKLDYVVITHYHDDHLGALRELGLPIGKLLDRGDVPAAPPYPVVREYLAFRRGLAQAEVLAPGRQDQITSGAADFEVRNLAANGVIWSGSGTGTRRIVPEGAEANENDLSLALRLRYGRFDYYTGGDLAGVVLDDAPAWHDLETPLAAVVGAVDVAVLNHHGWMDTTNNTFLRSLQPRVVVIPAWHASHPDHGVMRRLRSPRLGFAAPELFITELLPAPAAIWGYLGRPFQSTLGHVVVRVVPGGGQYTVYVLDAEREEPVVRSTHGPYVSR